MSAKSSSSPFEPLRALIPLGALVLPRLIFGIVVLLSIAFLSYVGLDMAGGATWQAALIHGVDRTADWVVRLAQGDLGMSGAGSKTLAIVPVADVVKETWSKSLGLIAVSLAFATVAGVGLGVWAAKRRHTAWSLITLLVSITGVSMPSFFAALLLQLAAIRWTKTFGKPLLPIGGFGWDERIILPALVLAARPIAQIARVTFVAVGEVLEQDMVRTAHGKGLAPHVVINRHVLRNVAIPILTTLGVSLRFSLSSLPLVEFFFSWPGTGFMLLKAISQRDDNLTVALVLCLGVLFMTINLLLDIAYRLIDPRLRDRIAKAGQRERPSLLQLFVDVGAALNDSLKAIWARVAAPAKPAAPSPFRDILRQRGIAPGIDVQKHRLERRRAWFRGTIGNSPLALGGVLVLLLIGLVVFGPSLAPHSPYTTRGLEYVDGKLSVPPFAPDRVHPFGTDVLGRDVLSLILAGAQQTCLLTVLVVSARVGIGFCLGALAGWFSGGWLDRVLLGLAEIVSAFPTLLLAMTLILALGIRQGMRPFVIALCLAGWSEIMQFVRSKVMSIQPRLFIESAVASGLRTPRIILAHVLPNLLPSLISITALEMGAVLMLLGELGFIGIFIGGGAFAELDIGGSPYHYSDVPEWGALLSNVRLYARAYPWMALYPTMAFFLAIWGFNLFGEGVRRMIERVGVGMTRVLNRYTVALAVVAVVTVGWAQSHTGSVAFYRQQAAAFDAGRAMAHIQALCAPNMQGRALGAPGSALAAEYIAQQFRQMGIQPAGETVESYFQTHKRDYEILDAAPGFEIVGDPATWRYRRDYAEQPTYYRNMGQAQAPVRVIAWSAVTWVRGTFGGYYKGLEDLDVANDIVLTLSPDDAFVMRQVARRGMLVVVEDELELARRATLSMRDPTRRHFGTNRVEGFDTPTLMISEAVANQLLAGAGYTVDAVRREIDRLLPDQRIEIATGAVVAMDVPGAVVEKQEVYHVLGHLPGLSSSEFGGINDQVIVVLAQYDTPPPGPAGVISPAANDNASGVAVMLEIARVLSSSGYQPYRTLVFIAYSGEGLEGGMPVVASDVSKFLQGRKGFASLDVEAIIHLRGLGAGSGKALVVSSQGSMRLARLFEDAARKMGVRTRRAQDAVEIGIIFEDKGRWEGGQEAAEALVAWQGWQETSRLSTDTLEAISTSHLDQAGRALTLALMIMGRETDY